MTWYSLELGDGVAAFGPSGLIQEAFSPIFLAAGMPPDMAVFTKKDSARNVITAYFSPGAHALAAMFRAVPCSPPSRDGIRLLVGDQRGCWDLFEAG